MPLTGCEKIQLPWGKTRLMPEISPFQTHSLVLGIVPPSCFCISDPQEEMMAEVKVTELSEGRTWTVRTVRRGLDEGKARVLG